MLPIGLEPFRVGFLGAESSVASLSDADGGPTVDVTPLDATRLVDRGLSKRPLDCLLLESTASERDCVDVLRRCVDERPDVPVVVLREGDEPARSVEALQAGASETLPSRLAESNPEFLARRVAEVVRRTWLETGLGDVYDAVDEGVTLYDSDAEAILRANRPFCELLERPRETVRSASLAELTADVSGYDAERARDAIKRVTRQGDPTTLEWPFETADGDARWTDLCLDTVSFGRRKLVVWSVTDVTERKRREREYEQIFNGVTEGIAIQDPDTADLLDANRTFIERLGYDDVDEVRRQGIRGLSVTENGYTKASAQELCQRVMETGEPEVVEWQQETEDGDRLWIEAKVNSAVIGGEQRVVSMQRNVTERKRREREYQQIFHGVSDAITVHDPETGRLIDLNETMCELTGYSREELLDTGQEPLAVPEEGYSSERARAIVRDVMETGESRTLEWLIERKDGKRRWLEINATPTRLNGQERYLALMRDVTEKRRTERRLREILERIDEAIYLTRAAEVTDPVLRDDDLSAGYESIWGQSLEAIFENNDGGFFDTLHPDEERSYREFVDSIGSDIDDGAVADRYAREYRIVRSDGEVRWVRSDFYPIEWPSGPLRLVIVSRDITERKERERRIASFNEATDDLTTADTPEEATRTAVEAATETLALPGVGAFLYDGDDGVLRPEVLQGSLPADVVTGRIGSGDGPLWESFATGTVVTSDDGRSDDRPRTAADAEPQQLDDLREWHAIALGNHGVLLVGAPEQPLGPETIQAAHVLAATLEAALNHLQGQKQLAEQEEQLRTQAERANRLDRIARLSQQVEAAITDASNPREVQQAVCDRLVTSGSYDVAWIGGSSVGTDRLSPRAVAGTSTGYVETLNLTTADDTVGRHPSVAAWQTDEVCVADSLVGDGPTAEWCQRALAEGIQSLCAVPLTYDGVTHGVLTVGAESPNAFSERERGVLSQLGTSIANALVAIERRRALESDETVELEFRGTGTGLSFSRAADAADCRVSLTRTVAQQNGRVSLFFRFENPPEDVPGIAERTLPGEADIVAEDASSTLVEVQADDWFGSPLAEYGGVLRDASAEPDGTVVTMEVPRQADVRAFVEQVQSVAPSLELAAKRQHRREGRTPEALGERVRDALTDRQLEVLRTALSAGYFEWPRENDGCDVADRLDITQPTLNKHLRLAERKAFELLLDADA
jgi:PAS domain S-box-containing protein